MGMGTVISEEVIAHVAHGNDIVEVIGAHIPLVKEGENFTATCPFHGDNGFQVNPRTQAFKCFGCGSGGTVFRFIMSYDQIPFGAALQKLAKRAEIQLPEL